jgi:vacuolar-type H+-ATPase subunit I/STV1
MIYPAKMNKLRIFSLKEKKDEIVEFLQKEGILHLTKSEHEKFSDGLKFDWHVELSDLTLKIRGIAAMLNISPEPTQIRHHGKVIEQARKMLDKLVPAGELVIKRKSIDEKIGDLKKDLAEINEFRGVYDKEIPKSFFAFGLKGNMKKLSAFKNEVESNGICLKCSDIEKRKKDHCMVILSKKSPEETLSKYGLSAFSFPKEGLLSRQKNANESIVDNAEDLREIDARLAEMKNENREELSRLLYEIESLSERTKASENFMASKNVMVM